ncbi:MAG TPA: hypothetical protein VF723_06510 [Pyrinomonadaceae bacterium]
MRIKLFTLALAFIALGLSTAAPAYANGRPELLARQAVSVNAAESAAAIAELRALGPAGLEALRQVFAEEIRRAAAAPGGAVPAADANWERIAAALDGVSRQRNSYASGLYWYTDFEQAVKAAKASGKPILSLRLLGQLDEEFSCANSRFFRTVLYANREVSAYLREHFILHWKSVRPAPRVTVDFGDGRKLERTVTGNSIHYILDRNGSPVDALPGLYGPAAFLRGLAGAEAVARQLAADNAQQRSQILDEYHRARIKAISAAWIADVEKTGSPLPEAIAARTSKGKTPSAVEVAALAMTKSVTEASIVRGMTSDATALEAATDMTTWNKIAALHGADARLDESSLALIARQNANLRETPELMARLRQNLESYIALDTVRNEYMLRTKLHAWLAAGAQRLDVERLNERVYAELFLTPRSDPWLGLYSPDIYTALDNGGISK